VKGIFITTSSFTKDALASVREYSSRIILIDGINLADYMMDHAVGVSIASTYEIKKIDSDFFEEDIE
jgi:restriction system protein